MSVLCLKTGFCFFAAINLFDINQYQVIMEKALKHLSSNTIDEDIAVQIAVDNIPNYQSTNQENSKEMVAARKKELDDATREEKIKKDNYSAARTRCIEAQHAFHECMNSVKAQILAQFGPNSNEIKNCGLKKQSEYKKRTPKKK